MAEICGWPDCKSSEMQAHAVTHQCLTCGRHSRQGLPVIWVMGPESRWERAHPEPPVQDEAPEPVAVQYESPEEGL